MSDPMRHLHIPATSQPGRNRKTGTGEGIVGFHAGRANTQARFGYWISVSDTAPYRLSWGQAALTQTAASRLQ
jgi:hypothetical protein